MPTPLPLIYQTRKRTIHIGPWSMWRFDPELIPLGPEDIEDERPVDGEFLGLSKDAAEIAVTYQLAYLTYAGDQAASKASVEKTDMEISGNLLTVADSEGQSLRALLSGNLIDGSGAVGKPDLVEYEPFPVCLISRNNNRRNPGKLIVVALYAAVCESIRLSVTKKQMSRHAVTLKGIYAEGLKAHGLGKIFTL